MLKFTGQSGARIAKAAIVSFALILAGCKGSEHRSDSRPAGNARQNIRTAAQSQKPLPPCPPGVAPKLQSATTSRRHHQVVLSWNPSTSSTGPQDKSLGYCLYRSDKPIPAKKIAECRNCELISPTPIMSTGCVDVDVEDGQTYFYAVLAVQAGKRDPSLFSNKAKAPIPRKRPGPHPPNSYPLCREPSPTNQVPSTPTVSNR
jgi:hypothetical protein